MVQDFLPEVVSLVGSLAGERTVAALTMTQKA